MNRTRNFSEFKIFSKTLEGGLWYQNSTDNIKAAKFQSKNLTNGQLSISPRPKSNLRSSSSLGRKLRVKFNRT